MIILISYLVIVTKRSMRKLTFFFFWETRKLTFNNSSKLWLHILKLSFIWLANREVDFKWLFDEKVEIKLNQDTDPLIPLSIHKIKKKKRFSIFPLYSLNWTYKKRESRGLWSFHNWITIVIYSVLVQTFH